MTNITTRSYKFLVVGSMLAWIASIVFSGIYMAYFAHDFKNQSDRFRFEISPAPWAFQIWYLIYLWQFVFFIYSIVSLFPKYNLPQPNPMIFSFYCVQTLCMTVGGVVATKFMHWASFGTIFGMTISIYAALVLSIRDGRTAKSALYTLAVQNGLAILAGWLTIATLLSMGIALVHGCMHTPQRYTGAFALGILMFQLVIVCGLELTVFRKSMRYIWSHYLALIVACAGILAKNWDPMNMNSIFTVAISGFVACATVVKVFNMLTGMKRRKPSKCEEEPYVSVDIEKKYLEAQLNGL